MPLMDGSKETYHQVIVRVNLAEVLGGPARNQEASALLQVALGIAAGDAKRLAGFWRNVATMFHRLGDEGREEAALEGLSPYLGSCDEATQRTVSQRILELQASLIRVRPMEPEAAIRFR